MNIRDRKHRKVTLLRAGLAFALPLVLVTLPRPASAQGIGHEDLREMMSWERTSLILFDKLEYVPNIEGRPVVLDATGWYGGAVNRLWFRAEADQLTTERSGEGEAQLHYGHLITPFWDVLAGLRLDQHWGIDSQTRAHLALGLTGLAPLRFELSPTLFLSHDGDLSARLEAAYQVLITQRLVLEPDIELNAALQEVSEWHIGSGFNDVELAVRLRYEIIREFSPYIGIAWFRRLGGTADFEREADESVGSTSLVVGLRMWR